MSWARNKRESDVDASQSSQPCACHLNTDMPWAMMGRDEASTPLSLHLYGRKCILLMIFFSDEVCGNSIDSEERVKYFDDKHRDDEAT